MMRRLRRLLGIGLVAIVLPTCAAAATTVFTFPKPGTTAQVSALVASSSKITSIPSNLWPALSDVPNDSMANTTLHATGQGCLTVSPTCTYGNKSAKRLVVLFGDSHAWMWLAAVNPILVKNNFRLQLLWKIGCPVATLTQLPNAPCTQWRSSTIALITSEKPTLVLLSERTTDIYSTPSTLMTSAQWTSGMEATIAALKTATTKVAVIGDIPAYANLTSPVACLSANPSAVQKCSIPRLNKIPKWADQSAAEKAATKVEGAGFIDPKPWLCGKISCSEIEGTMPVYWDWSHVAATYSGYLATVMGAKIRPFL